MVATLVAALAGVVFVQRVVELRIARRNEAWARDEGATEFGAKHYPAFFVLHIGWSAAWIAEALVGDHDLPRGWWVWVVVFAATQGLRYWAIRSLGRRWNTRVLVLPGRAPIVAGPYRFIRHPNYVAVGLELLSVPLAVGAFWTAGVASVLNLILLMLVRIPCEERALVWAQKQERPGRAKPAKP